MHYRIYASPIPRVITSSQRIIYIYIYLTDGFASHMHSCSNYMTNLFTEYCILFR